MGPTSEPRNPFYILLLVAGVVFTVNALAVAVLPVLEKKWEDEGQEPPPSPFREALREDGWKWLLGEMAAVILFGIASMGLDRYRQISNQKNQKLETRN